MKHNFRNIVEKSLFESADEAALKNQLHSHGFQLVHGTDNSYQHPSHPSSSISLMGSTTPERLQRHFDKFGIKPSINKPVGHESGASAGVINVLHSNGYQQKPHVGNIFKHPVTGHEITVDHKSSDNSIEDDIHDANSRHGHQQLANHAIERGYHEFGLSTPATADNSTISFHSKGSSMLLNNISHDKETGKERTPQEIVHHAAAKELNVDGSKHSFGELSHQLKQHEIMGKVGYAARREHTGGITYHHPDKPFHVDLKGGENAHDLILRHTNAASKVKKIDNAEFNHAHTGKRINGVFASANLVHDNIEAKIQDHSRQHNSYD